MGTSSKVEKKKELKYGCYEKNKGLFSIPITVSSSFLQGELKSINISILNISFDVDALTVYFGPFWHLLICRSLASAISCWSMSITPLLPATRNAEIRGLEPPVYGGKPLISRKLWHISWVLRNGLVVRQNPTFQ